MASTEKIKQETVESNMQIDGTKDKSDDEALRLTNDGPDEASKPTDLCDVYKALSDMNMPGSTCTGGPAPMLPSTPGIHVEGVGLVSLPITAIQANILRDVAAKHPQGRGLDTTTDASVLKTLQFDSHKVSLKNPAWAPALKKLVHQAAEGLGITPGLVRAELNKVLLNEPGGFLSKKRRDTEKTDGVLATLAIFLPSDCSGGSFVVSHHGYSRTFRLDNPQIAPYGCQFIAHYADCEEYEMRPIESGYQLVLIYSLFYTGEEKHQLSADNFKDCGMSSILSRLPHEKSVFCWPLLKIYAPAALARLGAGTLKGSDRAKQQAFEMYLADNQWQMVLAKLQKPDKSGYESCDGYSEEESPPSICDAYHVDGSDASRHLEWMNQKLVLQSVDADNDYYYRDDGMVLESEDCVEAMLGKNSSYILVVFSDSIAFKHMCQINFSDAIKEVVRRPEQFRTLVLPYMAKKKPSISFQGCLQLMDVGKIDQLTTEETGSCLGTILGCLRMKSVPTKELTDSLLQFVERYGWTTTTEPIRYLLVQQLANIRNRDCSDFLDKVNFLLRCMNVPDSAFLIPVFNQTVATFEAEPASAPSPASSGSRRMPGTKQSENLHNKSSVASVANRITALSSKYGWDRVKRVAVACFSHIRKQCDDDPEVLAERLVGLDIVQNYITTADVESLRREIVEDIVKAIEVLPVDTSRASTIWTIANADLLVRELLEHGVDAQFKRIETWATKAALAQLTQAKSMFVQVAALVPSSQSQDAVARARCIEKVASCELQGLYSRQLKLIEATSGGEPVFSWSMPNASDSIDSVKAFLASPQQVSKTFRFQMKDSHIQHSSVDSFEQGYSATSRRKSKHGEFWIVTKTRAYHDALVKQYRLSKAELSQVQENIQRIVGPVMTPPVAAASPEVVHPGGEETEPPAKKRARTNTEIIGI